MMEEDAATDLARHGVAVLPMLCETTELAAVNAHLFRCMDEFPEYAVKGRHTQRVLGGFGALGNPSSFHHPFVRKLRRDIKKRIADRLFRPYARHRYGEQRAQTVRLEKLFDRLCVRNKTLFGSVSGELWHRDTYDAKKGLRPLPRTLPSSTGDDDAAEEDLLFGGWLNLDVQTTQVFLGLLGSHHHPLGEMPTQQAGFAPIARSAHATLDAQLKAQATQDAGERLRFDARTGGILVPPGHAIVFRHAIVHKVAAPPPPSRLQMDEAQLTSLRLFCAYRLTTESSPLFANTLDVMRSGAVPHLPSGQIPPMFSQNHYTFFASPKTDKYRTWAERTFVDAVLFRRYAVMGGQRADDEGDDDRRRREESRQRWKRKLVAHNHRTALSELGDPDDEDEEGAPRQAANPHASLLATATATATASVVVPYYTPGRRDGTPHCPENRGRYMCSLVDAGLMSDKFRYRVQEARVMMPELLFVEAEDVVVH